MYIKLSLQIPLNQLISYSLRKVNPSYNGNAIRVRRIFDNSEQDIGFVSNGDLDETSLINFVTDNGNQPTSNGAVHTIYDQSGNGRHAIQTSAGNQAFIIENGVLITQNGMPAIRKLQGREWFMPEINPPDLTLSAVITPIYSGLSNANILMSDRSGSPSPGISYGFYNFSTGAKFWNFGATSTSEANYVNNVLTDQFTEATAHVFASVVKGLSNTTSQMYLGQNTNGTNNGEYYLQELLMYDRDETANLTSLYENQKQYWNVPI